MANKFRTDTILKNINLIKSTAPRVLANQAQNFFSDSFKKSAWNDFNTVKWEEVKRRTPGTFEYKYPKKKGLSRRSSPILVRTGKLRRAVGNSIRTVTFEKIELIVPLVYADVHNTGTNKIPKRQFMGDSKTLRAMQLKSIYQQFNKVWQV